MRILNRYIIKEMIGPTALGFVFYTIVLLMRSLIELAELIIQRTLPYEVVVRLLLYSVPHIIVLTIPMSLIVGILIAVGRLSADSEIVAMRAAGMSTSSIYRPVFYFSFAFFLLNLYLMNVVLPEGNYALQKLRAEIATSATEQQIEPKVFYDQFDGWMVYVHEVESDGTWKGVFLADASDPMQQRIVLAESGRLVNVRDQRQIWAELTNARTYLFSHQKPEKYDVNTNGRQRFLLKQLTADDKLREVARSYTEMNLEELLKAARVARDRDPVDYRILLIEIHKKLSIPFACLSFGILGLPLGITNRRGGKSSGFSLSVGIILFYYTMLNGGEDLAKSGKLHPALAMWLPNIVLLVIGIYLIIRANADRGSSQESVLSRMSGRLRRHLPRGGQVGAAGTTEERASFLSRLDIPFPNIIDRYILAQFCRILAMVTFSTVALFITVDYMTVMSGEMAKSNAPLSLVIRYYRYFSLETLDKMLPISVLIATLVTFGILAKNNEITAIKANGISLYRIAMPILGVAMVLSACSYLFLDYVLPYSTQRVAELKAKIKKRDRPRSATVQQKQWVFGKGRYLFNFLGYDGNAKSLAQVQVFDLAPEGFRLERQLFAEEARFDGVSWLFFNGWSRTFGADGTTTFERVIAPLRLPYSERPEYFATEVRKAEHMTYLELRRYIETLQNSGYTATEEMVKLHTKTSWPFITVVMALIALPFSFRAGKQGALYGVGIALVLAFVYWGLFGVFTKFGEVGSLPAMLAAWSANIIFALGALYMFLKVET